MVGLLRATRLVSRGGQAGESSSRPSAFGRTVTGGCSPAHPVSSYVSGLTPCRPIAGFEFLHLSGLEQKDRIFEMFGFN